MTENTMTSLDTETEAGSSKRPLILAGGVAGALALGAAGYFLLLGGGSSTASPAPYVPPQHVGIQSAAAVGAASAVKPAAKTTLPQVSTARLGRDPFKALYVVPAAAPAATTPAVTSTSTTPMSGTSTTPGTTGTMTATQPYTLTLLSVSTVPGGAHVYAFNVGGVKKSVLAAQRFGKYGELVVLAYATGSRGQVVGAIVQVGDDNPVEVPIGGKISVL